jgi:hypothetical protein
VRLTYCHRGEKTAGVYSSLYDRPPVIRLQTTYDSTETTITPTVATLDGERFIIARTIKPPQKRHCHRPELAR